MTITIIAIKTGKYSHMIPLKNFLIIEILLILIPSIRWSFRWSIWIHGYHSLFIWLKCCKTKITEDIIFAMCTRTIRSLYPLGFVSADTPIILSISTQSISNLSVTPLIFCILITTHIIEYCINPLLRYCVFLSLR